MTSGRSGTQAGAWLEELLDAVLSGKPVLVLCRTTATVRGVYRRLAAEAAAGGIAGWPGLQIATLQGLCSSAAPGELTAAEPALTPHALPKGHAWKALLDERPRLRGMLRRHAERLHGAALAGADLAALAPEFRALLDAGWCRPEELEGARRLLAAPPPEGVRLCVGFAQPGFSFQGTLGPLETTLLRHLEPTFVDAGHPLTDSASPLEALWLPDVAAEARAAVRAASPVVAQGGQVLVLVTDGASEERIHAAFRRNGLAVADDAAAPLSRHALVSIAEPLLPVIASHGKEPLEVFALLRLFTDPVLSRQPPRGVDVAVPGIEHPRASVRHVRDILVNLRRVRAPVAEWLAAVTQIEKEACTAHDEADADGRPRAAGFLASARVLRAQLERLAHHAKGSGRLSDLAALLDDLGLSAPTDDRLGHAIILALRENSFRSADPEDYADVLGRSISSGRVEQGVQVLPYGSYDGRPCDLLLLTGVHDKGLTRAPAPDPFLSDGSRRALALPTPLEAVHERVALARWAVSRSAKTLALVSETDASGRRVSPPVDLSLRFDDRDRHASYGIPFDLPENRDRRALEEGAEKATPLARQVDLEWVRAGATFAPFDSPESPETPTLNYTLAATLPRLPTDLLPWLGEVGQHPRGRDGLPPHFTLSATRFGHFAQCLYRAFLDSVLRLRPIEEVEEDLDAREIGNALHAALATTLPGVTLLVPEVRLKAERARVLAALRKATETEVEKVAGERASETDSRAGAVARGGLTARWLAHWESYIGARLRSVEEGEVQRRAELLAPLEEGKVLAAAVNALGPDLKMGPTKQLQKNLLAALIDSGGRLEELLDSEERIVTKLAARNVPLVSAALKQHSSRPALQALCSEAAAILEGQGYAANGDLQVIACELPFGALDARGSHSSVTTRFELELGRAPIPFRGKIDAVIRRDGRTDGTPSAHHVVDFKSGYVTPAQEELVGSLTSPQIALYALVLESMGMPVERLVLDFIRHPQEVAVNLEPATLSRVRGEMGQLLDRARDGLFPLAPHPDTCPLAAGRYCNFQEVCRLRPSFSEAPAAAEGES